MFPWNVSQKPEVELEPANRESPAIKGLLNLNDWCFRGIFFALGIAGANTGRAKPEFAALFIAVGITAVFWLLFIPPRNTDSQFLYRSVGLAFTCGVAFVFWEMLQRVNAVHFVVAAFVTAVLVACIGRGE